MAFLWQNKIMHQIFHFPQFSQYVILPPLITNQHTNWHQHLFKFFTITAPHKPYDLLLDLDPCLMDPHNSGKAGLTSNGRMGGRVNERWDGHQRRAVTASQHQTGLSIVGVHTVLRATMPVSEDLRAHQIGELIMIERPFSG